MSSETAAKRSRGVRVLGLGFALLFVVLCLTGLLVYFGWHGRPAHWENEQTRLAELSDEQREAISESLRNRLLNATAGTAVMHHNFYEYEFFRGSIPGRSNGAMIANETGQVTSYALQGLADRGTMFVAPGSQVYEGMIVATPASIATG